MLHTLQEPCGAVAGRPSHRRRSGATPAIGEGQARAGEAEHAQGGHHDDVETTPTLLMTVDLVDSATKAVVWHGSGEIVAHSRPEDAKLWELVQAILARFPPTGPVEE